MTPVSEALLGLGWLVSLILNIVAAAYCYRITRITGGFRAWWLLIAFTILFAVTSFTSAAYTVLSTQLSGTTSSVTELSSTALFDAVLDFLMSVLLFGAMFELHRTFKRQQKTS